MAALLNPDDFDSSASYVAAVKALPDPAAHPDNAAMADEHAALFALVPRDQATHVAIKNGSWFDTATWADERIPSEGARVLIPEAIAVNYDGVSDTSLFTVRVDGKLLFASDHNTRVVVDTLVVAKTGLLQIGTSEHPIQDGITADVVIADNGPIDVNWDPLLLSRGIISHGSTEIHGQEKTSFLKLALDPLAGSTLLHFDDDAKQNGWHVGDKIVVTGTHIAPQQVNGDWVDIGSQDEVRTIKAIYGTTVILDQPLNFNHDSPRADLKAYVADYTRNVVIETQNANDVPVTQRGHVMFMHSPSVDVEYAEFSELGRTDKSTRAVDAETTAGITSDTNVKGRYALHLHETGDAPGSQEAIIKGNSVWGSPGWGIVQHASSADIENNATFNTFGAGYVAETGDETGLWHKNIAIQAHGIGAGPWVDKNADDVAAFDLARDGIGFYFQGRMIKATDNVAAGVNEGFVYLVRGTSAVIDAANLAQPEILHGLSSTDVAAAPIQNFKDNEVIAASYGFIVIKANPAQDHDVRSVIDGFKAWETDIGVHLEYTSHYTFLDTDLTGPNVGRDFEPKGIAGVELGTSTFDIVVNRSQIANYRDAVILDKIIAGVPVMETSPTYFNYVFIDLKTHDIQGKSIKNFDPSADKLLTSSELRSMPATLEVNWHDIPVWSFDWPGGRSIILDGIKHDDIGDIPYRLGNEAYNIGRDQMEGLLTHQGYYTTEDGRKIVVLEEYYSDRATGEIFKTSIPIQISDNVPLTQDPWFLIEGDAKWLGKIDLTAVAPLAKADTALTTQSTGVVIDVLKNDIDPNGLTISIDGITQPAHGQVSENPDGTLNYTPHDDFIGVETFKYWVTDQNAKFDAGIVTISVASGNESPSEIPSGRGADGDGGEPIDTPSPVVDVPAQVPGPPERSPKPLPVIESEDTANAPIWMEWKYGHIHFDNRQYNHSFDEIGPPRLEAFAAPAQALKEFLAQYSAYDPLPPFSVMYDKGFGHTTEADIGSRFGDTGDQLAWKLSSTELENRLFLAESMSEAHSEAFFGADIPIVLTPESTFAFRNFDNASGEVAHLQETSSTPNFEHLGLLSSGFIFS